MDELQPHQQRVVDERKQLDEKFNKLVAFTKTGTFQSLPPEERYRLDRQCGAMLLYSSILGERIAAFQSTTK